VSLPNGKAQGRSGADKESLGFTVGLPRLFHFGVDPAAYVQLNGLIKRV
jgi:hypothetical protein